MFSGNVLHIGCNTGSTSKLIREMAPWAHVIGLDINRAALKRASGRRVNANVLELPFADKSISCIVALDIIEHIYESDMEQFVDECARVLRNYGRLLGFSPRTDPVKPSSAALDSCHVQFFREPEEFAEAWLRKFSVKVKREQRTNPSGRGAHDAWLMHACM